MTIEQAAKELTADAIEGNVSAESFEAFCREMWSDDHDMDVRGMSRENYEAALLQAFHAIREQRAQ